MIGTGINIQGCNWAEPAPIFRVIGLPIVLGCDWVHNADFTSHIDVT